MKTTAKTKADWIRIGDNDYVQIASVACLYRGNDNAKWFAGIGCGGAYAIESQYVASVFKALGISPLSAKAKRKAKR